MTFKLIFNQQLVAPQKVPPGARIPQPPLANATALDVTYVRLRMLRFVVSKHDA